jgi:hypothetical protein
MGGRGAPPKSWAGGAGAAQILFPEELWQRLALESALIPLERLVASTALDHAAHWLQGWAPLSCEASGANRT